MILMQDWMKTKSLTTTKNIYALSKGDFNIENLLKEKIRLLDVKIFKEARLNKQIILLELQLKLIQVLQKERANNVKKTGNILSYCK